MPNRRSRSVQFDELLAVGVAASGAVDEGRLFDEERSAGVQEGCRTVNGFAAALAEVVDDASGVDEVEGAERLEIVVEDVVLHDAQAGMSDQTDECGVDVRGDDLAATASGQHVQHRGSTPGTDLQRSSASRHPDVVEAPECRRVEESFEPL